MTCTSSSTSVGCCARRLPIPRLPRDRPLQDLVWDYPVDEKGEPSAEAVLQEINGSHLTGEHAGEMLKSYTEMKADGSTSGGCWIYTGVYAGSVNQSARRKPGQQQSWVAPEWGWAWPANRRVLYNRASADPDGKPWSERKALVWWDAEKKTWTGHDVPDFPADTAPDYRPEPGTGGPKGLAGDDPFIMQGDGKGWLFAPTGLLDGPLPTHYEPQESPVSNAFYRQQANPTRQVFRRTDNLQNPSGDDGRCGSFPVRVHHLSADRASHGGRDESLAAVPVRAAARILLRDFAGAGEGTQAGTHGLGHDRHGPHRHRGARDGHRPGGTAAGRRPHHSPGRAALPLGGRRRRDRQR